MNDKELKDFQLESYELFKKYGLTKDMREREHVLLTMLISPIVNDETMTKQSQANAILSIVHKLQNAAVNLNTQDVIERVRQDARSL